MPRHEDDHSLVPFRVDESTNLKVNIKTLIAIIGATALCAWSWFSIKTDIVDAHREAASLRTEFVEFKTDYKHDRDVMNGQLNYLVNGRKGPQPTPVEPTHSSSN